MYILIVANVLKLLIGTVSNVKYYLNVLEAKSLIVIIYALALKVMYGQRIYVYIHLVMEAKFGLDLNVYAQQDWTLMEPCVLNALMAKNGIQKFQLVLANQVIDGTGNFVKNLMFVQTVEYGTQHINNVSALIIPIGVDMLVYLLKNV